jgi:hypothetical protein
MLILVEVAVAGVRLEIVDVRLLVVPLVGFAPVPIEDLNRELVGLVTLGFVVVELAAGRRTDELTLLAGVVVERRSLLAGVMVDRRSLADSVPVRELAVAEVLDAAVAVGPDMRLDTPF